jgi:hypothetical protein
MAKQQVAQEKLQKELENVKKQDKTAQIKEQEREQIRKEVEARFQAEASDFVQAQIQQAQEQMRQQFDLELQSRINALSIGNRVDQVPQVEMKDESQSQSEQVIDTQMLSASRVRQRNQTNMIRNRSLNSSIDQ